MMRIMLSKDSWSRGGQGSRASTGSGSPCGLRRGWASSPGGHPRDPRDPRLVIGSVIGQSRTVRNDAVPGAWLVLVSCFGTSGEFDHNHAWFAMASGDRQQQLEVIGAAVTCDDSGHVDRRNLRPRRSKAWRRRVPRAAGIAERRPAQNDCGRRACRRHPSSCRQIALRCAWSGIEVSSIPSSNRPGGVRVVSCL